MFHPQGGVLRRFARAVPDVWELGVTRPVPGVNVGARSATTAYTGTGAGGTLTVSAPATFTNVDFGTTLVKVESSNVVFDGCRWTWTKTNASHSTAGGVVDFRNSTARTGDVLRDCTIVNASQYSPGMTGVLGSDFTMERCVVEGFTDNVGVYVPSSRVDGALNVSITGCYLGAMSWFWASSDGVVHPSDNKTHNDGIQWQGGRGLNVEGCDIQAFYSATLGTGTPSSGSDTGVSVAPYSQAAGEAARASIVNASGQKGMGGSLAGILFSSAGRGLVPACTIRNNWIGGGAYSINDGVSVNDSGLTYSFGEVSGNRFDRTQRIDGWAIGIHTGTTALVTGNTWTDDGSTVVRRNA